MIFCQHAGGGCLGNFPKIIWFGERENVPCVLEQNVLHHCGLDQQKCLMKKLKSKCENLQQNFFMYTPSENPIVHCVFGSSAVEIT